MARIRTRAYCVKGQSTTLSRLDFGYCLLKTLMPNERTRSASSKGWTVATPYSGEAYCVCMNLVLARRKGLRLQEKLLEIPADAISRSSKSWKCLLGRLRWFLKLKIDWFMPFLMNIISPELICLQFFFNWTCTLLCFFKFVSRANNSKSCPLNNWPRK